MKKLIGLLGAAGLLLPSAAMAGSIGDEYGSEALRVSGVSASVVTVTVESDIDIDNSMTVGGSNNGSDLSISAEAYYNGTRDYGFENYDVTAQTDTDIDVDLRADAHYDVDGKLVHENDYKNTRKVFEGQEYEPGSTEKKCRLWHCTYTHTEATPEEPRKVVRKGFDNNTYSGEANGVVGGGIIGTFDAVGTLDSQGETLIGGGSGTYINGSFNMSDNHYNGNYDGTLKEEGNTETSVHSVTTSASTFNGFESGSFNTTSWN